MNGITSGIRVILLTSCRSITRLGVIQVMKGLHEGCRLMCVLCGMSVSNTRYAYAYPGADPGIPVEGAPTVRGGGGRRQHTKLPNFPKNCIKLRKFRAVGGAKLPPAPPLNPSMMPIRKGCFGPHQVPYINRTHYNWSQSDQ